MARAAQKVRRSAREKREGVMVVTASRAMGLAVTRKMWRRELMFVAPTRSRSNVCEVRRARGRDLDCGVYCVGQGCIGAEEGFEFDLGEGGLQLLRWADCGLAKRLHLDGDGAGAGVLEEHNGRLGC